MTDRQIVVVDGANVAYIEQDEAGKPRVGNLVAVREALCARGYDPIIIVDASLAHETDDPDALEQLLDAQVVRQAPAGTDADFFIVETAARYEAAIVSNDQFEAYRDRAPWIAERRIPLMIIRGEVELYAPQLDTR